MTTTSQLIDRLAAHRMLTAVPREQLQWLVSHGELREYAGGDIVSRAGDRIESLYVVLSGHISISVNSGAGLRKVLEWRAGDLAGSLPYSRMRTSPGHTVTEEPTEVLSIHHRHFPEMARDCYELTSICVHVMLDRARLFRAAELHDEKMLSLGKLSANLAHDLNNPASALARGAKTMASSLIELDLAFRDFAQLGLSDAQQAAVARLRDATITNISEFARSPLEAADREDAIAEWLAERHIDTVEPESLVNSNVTEALLDEIAGMLDSSAVRVVLRYVAANHTLRRLASEIETAATRIYTLVAAVKGYTYMDQATIPMKVDVRQGLSDTLTVLKSKARAKKVDLQLDAGADLPQILGFGGELNQVWSNLIDNAIDAAAKGGGHVTVAVSYDQQAISVRVIDDGTGIPEEIQNRIFEPRFTTKPLGEGTGLGLDIARQLVTRHDGKIGFTSKPGRTEFHVTLPIAGRTPVGSI